MYANAHLLSFRGDLVLEFTAFILVRVQLPGQQARAAAADIDTMCTPGSED
jgi:hypothetical protein